MRFLAALTPVVVLGLFCLPTSAQDAKPKVAAKEDKDSTTNALVRLLTEQYLETKAYSSHAFALKDATLLFYEQFQARGLECPIVIDEAAFRRVDPKLKVDEVLVRLPVVPKSLPAGMALQIFVNQLPVNATYLVRRDYVEIVPAESATAQALLQQKVMARYERRPLGEVLIDVASQMAISIAVDANLKDALAKEVSVTFRNDVTVRDALMILAQMNGLSVQFLPSGVLITAARDGA